MANSKGVPELITPYNTSDFNVMAEACRAHHHAVHDQYVTVASELQRGLSKVSGARGLFGMDTRIAAKRVTRHLMQAGALELSSAQAVVWAYTMYTQLFLGTKGAHTKGFDINK